jgi:RNA polymerase sigma-70 factor (ECF subfamily)
MLAAFRRGDRAALQRVYDAYKHQVERVMVGGAFMHGKRLLGARRDAVKDLIQEVFVRAFSAKARESYDPGQPYEPYLLGLARNVLAEHTRKSMREVASDDAGETLITEPDDTPEPHLRETAERYVRSLPPELDAVYKSRFVEAQSQYESAETLGLSRQRIRTLEQKLLEGLRALLQPKRPPPASGDT